MDRLAAMETFVRVVDTGSFTAAAKQLRVGQPAVSKTIAQLEDRLGVRLLLRSPRALTPTEAGEGFYARAKLVLEEASAAEQSARGAGVALSGRLRFAAPVTFARLQIVPRLPRFLADHPALIVDAILDDRRIDLIEEGVDVAIRMGAQPDSSLLSRRIGRSPRIVVAAQTYLKRAGTPKTPEDLKQHHAVLYGHTGGGSTWRFRQGKSVKTIKMRERFSASAAEGVREGTLAGLGLCLATEWMFRPELDRGDVVAVLTDWEMSPVDLWALFPTGNRPSAKARAFVDFLADEINRSEPDYGTRPRRARR
jgi:DNA-binding transcriptional LysR family regulator